MKMVIIQLFGFIFQRWKQNRFISQWRVEIQRYTGTKNRVFVIPDYYSLWRVKAAIMRRAKLGM